MNVWVYNLMWLIREHQWDALCQCHSVAECIQGTFKADMTIYTHSRKNERALWANAHLPARCAHKLLEGAFIYCVE